MLSSTMDLQNFYQKSKKAQHLKVWFYIWSLGIKFAICFCMFGGKKDSIGFSYDKLLLKIYLYKSWKCKWFYSLLFEDSGSLSLSGMV